MKRDTEEWKVIHPISHSTEKTKLIFRELLFWTLSVDIYRHQNKRGQYQVRWKVFY